MKGRHSLQKVFLLSSLVVVLTTLIFVAFFLLHSQRQRLTDSYREAVQMQVNLLTALTEERWRPDMPLAQSEKLAGELGRLTGMRVTLITLAGRVVGDSEVPPDKLSRLDNHSTRPEVMDALATGQGWSIRRSATLGLDLLYAAGLIGPVKSPRLVVRLAAPLSNVEALLDRNRSLIILATGLGVLLSLLVAWVVARRLARPVRELTDIALKLARGDLSQRIRTYPPNEFGELSRAFDAMAGNLESEMETVIQSKERLETILRGMVEGVLVLDGQGRVFLINEALRRMFDLHRESIGRPPSELIRDADLLEALSSVLGGQKYVGLEMRGVAPAELDLEVHIAGLPGGAGGGAVAVFHDVSERKRGERIKRDFVANVSHELRTPLTAIRGSAETLLEGGGLESPEHARRFTEMIKRHAVRLQNIVDDLLDLARIESGETALNSAVIEVDDLADEALNSVSAMAAERGVELGRDIPEPPFNFQADRRLIIEALVNLLDNAVKYTETGGRVVLSAEKDDQAVTFAVADTGIGIAPEHIARLFERFYRVDKDRSRAQGGTGLGLAIVKHIAQVHGGKIEVNSRAGEGSTFRLVIPRKQSLE